jgi:hypothetical protein
MFQILKVGFGKESKVTTCRKLGGDCQAEIWGFVEYSGKVRAVPEPEQR